MNGSLRTSSTLHSSSTSRHRRTFHTHLTTSSSTTSTAARPAPRPQAAASGRALQVGGSRKAALQVGGVACGRR